MKKHLASRIVTLSVCFLAAGLATGCASWRDTGAGKLVSKLDVPDGVPWKSKKPRSGTPRRMVVTWTDTVKQQAGVDAERGFGGRIFFYDASESEPIAVEGQLVVYAFDESDRLPTDNQPDKRYVFPPEQLALHEGDSELGVSYSVWLPWDKVSGKQTDVSLIARFESLHGGALVMSEQNRVRLPGQLTAPDKVQVAGHTSASEAASGSAVQYAGYTTTVEYEQPADGKQAPAAGMESTTIKLPARGKDR
ncbi:MAG: hypothetical protein KDA37_15365 [Planctomycetales bacterium]|nr:hypothetical protein [Planctomycetales bacterium]